MSWKAEATTPWLMQIVLFLTLGLLVFPSQIIPVLGIGLLVSAFLMFVARPFSVFAALLPFGLKLKTITFISWVGLRGAIPIVFATYPRYVAKLLHVAVPEKVKQRTPPDIELSDTMKSELTKIEIDDKSPAIGKKILEIGFPRAALIALINRRGVFITPNRSTIIEQGDKLVIIAENAESLKLVHECLDHMQQET